MMKRLMIGVATAATLAGPVAAQNTVPQVGVTSGYLAKSTYSSAFFGFVPTVTIGTDQLCIAGSATKTIRVQRITLWGTTTTAAQILTLALVKRNSADTGGTIGTTTANPGITTQIASRDTGQNPNTGATATLATYTAAPTIVDSAPVYIDAQQIALPIGLTTSLTIPGQVDFYFGRDVENNIAAPTLRGTNQLLCVNNTVAFTNASVLAGSVVWTEE